MKLYLLMCAVTAFFHTYEHYRDKKGNVHLVDDTCTAVWVAPDKLLSAGHCVSESDGQKWIEDLEMEHLQVRVIAADFGEDLVLLQTIKPSRHDYAKLGERVHVTAPVFMDSFEDNMAFVYGEGKVVAHWLDVDYSTHPFLASNILAKPGSSGGGVFNEKGKLVGLHVRTDTLGSYAVDQPVVKEFLEKHGVKN